MPAGGAAASVRRVEGPQPLSEQEFWAIYRKVPRLTVEVVVVDRGRVLLTKRDIEPCRGLWHLPGGTVRFGEPLAEAVARIARQELAITVTATGLLGCIEYPSHYLNGLDHPVGIAFRTTAWSGTVTPSPAASEHGWFATIPDPIHDEQRDFLAAHLALAADDPAGR